MLLRTQISLFVLLMLMFECLMADFFKFRISYLLPLMTYYWILLELVYQMSFIIIYIYIIGGRHYVKMRRILGE